MDRAVKHVQLHRIGTTELRVISDIDEGVGPLVQAEEEVIRRLMQRPGWPHRQVNLFVLQDLAPLARQLGAQAAALPGGETALVDRPVIHIYDLANLRRCTVFVNQQAMQRADYWADPLAVQGLLAHEHAHPLAENATTHASRQLRTRLDLPSENQPAVWSPRLAGLLAALVERLIRTAPREVVTNELAISSGFEAALLHLNRRNLATACHSLVGRTQLRAVLAQDVAHGHRPANDLGQLLLLSDLDSHLMLAMEVSAFRRAGRHTAADELTHQLQQQLFSALEPQVGPAFSALCRLYDELPTDMDGPALANWGCSVGAVLEQALAEQNLFVQIVVETLDAPVR